MHFNKHAKINLMKKKQVKAVALISNGLDSLLAAKIVKEQGIKVKGVYFTTPFIAGTSPATTQIGIAAKHIHLGQEYIEMVKKAEHGYGSGLNPCVDCKILMLEKAWEYAQETGADFLVTGDVLGQRPMSQHKQALELIEKEAGLGGKILRPLSAKLLPPTEAEEEGWVNRNDMLALQGRGRTEQMALAKKYKINKYETPAGGCPLTEKEYSRKVEDLFDNKQKVTERDIEFLKIGRHFRAGEWKIIVGRNKEENGKLLALKETEDIAMDAAGIPSPTTLVLNNPSEDVIKTAARLTARYSDAEDGDGVVVSYGKAGFRNDIRVRPLEEEKIEQLRI